MQVVQLTAHAPRAKSAQTKLMRQVTYCVDCKGCQGLCNELLELITLPDAILRKDKLQ